MPKKISRIVLNNKESGRNIEVWIQHSGNKNQSTGTMFFDHPASNSPILFSLDAENTGKLISVILKNWKGKKPKTFPIL